MIAPPRFYKQLGKSARAGNPLARQTIAMMKAQAIGAIPSMIALLFIAWLIID